MHGDHLYRIASLALDRGAYAVHRALCEEIAYHRFVDTLTADDPRLSVEAVLAVCEHEDSVHPLAACGVGRWP